MSIDVGKIYELPTPPGWKWRPSKDAVGGKESSHLYIQRTAEDFAEKAWTFIVQEGGPKKKLPAQWVFVKENRRLNAEANEALPEFIKYVNELDSRLNLEQNVVDLEKKAQAVAGVGSLTVECAEPTVGQALRALESARHRIRKHLTHEINDFISKMNLERMSILPYNEIENINCTLLDVSPDGGVHLTLFVVATLEQQKEIIIEMIRLIESVNIHNAIWVKTSPISRTDVYQLKTPVGYRWRPGSQDFIDPKGVFRAHLHRDPNYVQGIAWDFFIKGDGGPFPNEWILSLSDPMEVDYDGCSQFAHQLSEHLQHLDDQHDLDGKLLRLEMHALVANQDENTVIETMKLTHKELCMFVHMVRVQIARAIGAEFIIRAQFSCRKRSSPTGDIVLAPFDGEELSPKQEIMAAKTIRELAREYNLIPPKEILGHGFKPVPNLLDE